MLPSPPSSSTCLESTMYIILLQQNTIHWFSNPGEQNIVSVTSPGKDSKGLRPLHLGSGVASENPTQPSGAWSDGLLPQRRDQARPAPGMYVRPLWLGALPLTLKPVQGSWPTCRPLSCRRTPAWKPVLCLRTTDATL